MSAEAFLAIPILIIVWCGALIVLLYAIQIVGIFLSSVWETIGGWCDTIQDIINGRANR